MTPTRFLAMIACAALLPLLAACDSTSAGTPGPQSYEHFPAPDASAPSPDYAIGPGDVLSVTTFQEKDLTLDHVQVDASGNILLPLIGSVHAAGISSAALSTEIEARLAKRYLRDPQVSVIVTAAVSQKVTVDGSVTQAGVYPLQGETTLLQAIAMAKGPNRTARLGRVVIFRTIDARRQFAVFDVNAIRRGTMPDPEILGNDVVVVPFSTGKGAFRDLLAAVPTLGVFAVLTN
jgi:polysaccharide export outer membrane protein